MTTDTLTTEGVIPMSVINTNISALKAQNASMRANEMLGTAMERLSTSRVLSIYSDKHVKAATFRGVVSSAGCTRAVLELR